VVLPGIDKKTTYFSEKIIILLLQASASAILKLLVKTIKSPIN
jgi:hypothetical protein